jgi:CelD/BcsL family acetyltransferase involved in cellulose biosynthesis
MYFREAIYETCRPELLTGMQITILDSAARLPAGERRWTAFEHLVAHRYERLTGQVITDAFDWRQAVAWLIAELPALLKIAIFIFTIVAI